MDQYKAAHGEPVEPQAEPFDKLRVSGAQGDWSLDKLQRCGEGGLPEKAVRCHAHRCSSSLRAT